MAQSSFSERRGARATARLTLGVVLVAVGLVAASTSAPQGVRAAATVPTTWTPVATIPGVHSVDNPALVHYKSVLVAAWITTSSPYPVEYSTFNGTKWSAKKTVPGAQGDPPQGGPALGVYGDDLYVTWVNSSNQIWYSELNGSTWTPVAAVPSALTEQTPALAAYDGRLYLDWTDQTGNNVWYSSLVGTTWSVPQTIFSAFTYPQDAITALAVYDNELFTSWGGPGDKIWYASFNGNVWSSPSSFASEWDDGPGLAVHFGLLYDAWSDYYSQDVVYSTFNGSTWTAEATIPSADSLDPIALAAYHDHLYVAWIPGEGNVIDYASGP